MVDRPESAFEDIYRRAGDDLEAIPWASLTPHPVLRAWLARQPQGGLRDALVVGCGLGDDAEAAARQGYQVSAFDGAPTAIARCRERFPQSVIEYRVADLFALPERWRARFDLVVEVRTLQSLLPQVRSDAVGAIVATVAPGGVVWVRCLARDAAEPVGVRPWPVTPEELGWFEHAGLRTVEFREKPPSTGRGRSFTAVYQRAWP